MGPIVCGDLDWNMTPEVATIRGGSLILFQDPAVLDLSEIVATGALDVCYSPDAGGLGKPGFLFTAADGLWLVSNQSAHYDVTHVSSAQLWRGATCIRSAPERDAAGSTYSILVGIQSDPHNACTAVSEGAGFSAPATFCTLPTRTLLDLQLLNWDGDALGKMEVAIRHDNGIQLRPRIIGAAPIFGRSAIYPGGDSIVAMKKAGLSDSPAWLPFFGPGQQNLLLFNQSFATYQGPNPFSGATFGFAGAADVDGDGADDLLLAPGPNGTIGVATNQSSDNSWFQWIGNTSYPAFQTPVPNDTGPPPVTVTYSVDMRLSANSPASSVGHFVCANLFNDFFSGNTPAPGFAAVLNDLGGLRLVPNYGALTRNGTHAFVSGDFGGATLVEPCGVDAGRWDLALGTGWGSVPAANYIELIVRIKRAGVSTVDNSALHHALIPIDGSISNTPVSFTLGDEGLVDDEAYFAMVRPIHLDGTTLSTMTQAWRWSIAGLPTSPGARSYLESQSGAGVNDESQGSRTDCNPPPGQMGTRYIPYLVPQSHIPSSWPATQPTVLPPNY